MCELRLGGGSCQARGAAGALCRILSSAEYIDLAEEVRFVKNVFIISVLYFCMLWCYLFVSVCDGGGERDGRVCRARRREGAAGARARAVRPGSCLLMRAASVV